MTKITIMVINNLFRSTKLFRKGFNNMVLFSLQHGTLSSNMTDHIAMVASRNKLRYIQIPRMRLNEGFGLRAFLSTF